MQRDGDSCALLFFDLDHFKQINDQYGHGAGDQVLKQTAQLLHRVARNSDMVARVGGEEFLVVARHTARVDSHILAERIRAAIEAHPFLIEGNLTVRCTCSVGFSVYPTFLADTNVFTWEQIVEIADRCLYAAKKGGRNAWVGLVPDRESMAAASTLPRDIPTLLQSGRFPVMTSLKTAVQWG